MIGGVNIWNESTMRAAELDRECAGISVELRGDGLSMHATPAR
jgi:hypothetical protein